MIYTASRVEATKFYTQTLGFEILREFDDGIMIDLGSSILEIFDADIENKTNPAFCKLSLEVENVETFWDKLKDHQEIVFSLRHNIWGDTSFSILSPDGSTLIFFTKDK